MKKTHDGFTALELLIVIGIISVIVAIALVGLTRARIKSRDDSRISNMRIVQIALEDFKTACRNYPYSLESDTDNCVFSQTTTFGEFLNEVPENPSGTQFKYYPYANPSDPGLCIGYHLALELETQTHSGFNNDDDVDSASSINNTVPCDPSTESGFDGGNDDSNHLYDIYR